jgi:hypothetical protein
MQIDRSLLCHKQRSDYIVKTANLSSTSNHLVWLQSKEGKVFGSAIMLFQLGVNGVTSGDHAGLLWWPYSEDK